MPKAQNYATNDSMELNYTDIDNVVGLEKCWYYVRNSTGSTIIATITLTTCQNTTFALPGGDIDYTLSLFAKDILANINTETVTFGIRTESPVVVLVPINDTHTNTITDNYFNFTVDTNADSISSCQLWGDFNTTWHLNQTITTPTESIDINFTKLTLSEGEYYWNVNCSDNLGHTEWALNNHTYIVDTTFPEIDITTITPTAGSQTFTFNTSITELYSSTATCKYSIYNFSGSIDGLNENVSFNCGVEKSATVTTYGTYNLTTYIIEKAGNENSTTDSFLTEPAVIIIGGGGGTTVIVIESILSTNFSVTTLNRKKVLDTILAKDSVRPRKKPFIIANRGKDAIDVDLECGLVGNQTEEEMIMCEYVEFYDLNDNKIDSITVPALEENAVGFIAKIWTPKNSSFGDTYHFNILGIRYFKDGSSTYSKLSVTSRITRLATLYKWAYIPMQGDKPEEERGAYPIAPISIFFAFILFSIIFFIFMRFQMVLTGMFVGFGSFIGLLILLISTL